MAQCMLTTIDNGFNPFTQWDDWLRYDIAHGYNSCQLLGYFSMASNNLDDEDYEEETSYAIDRILELNPLGLYMKVYDYEADTLIPLANKAYKESIVNETALNGENQET